MSFRMGNPQRRFVKTLKAKRQDGSPVSVEEYLISGTDPTSTGTIWQNTLSYKVHRLSTGEPVECYDDGTATVSDTGEPLTLL
jgi:hypothetical protein